MNRSQLQQHYFKLERQFEANKTKRSIITILGFAVAFFAILYMVEKPTGFEIIANIFGSVILAGFHFFINAFIFGQLCSASHAENQMLSDIRKRLSELE